MPFDAKNILLYTLVVLTTACNGQNERHTNLETNFISPPQDAKPRTWMHAMSGNMSKAGLTKDLESMAEVGIGGLLLFNITQGIPNGPIIYNSPKHHEMINHAASESERLGLSFGVHNCDGWSSSGGPWVTPEESMKMVVWSETIVDGGAVNVILQEPSRREGLYEDIAVIAYPSLSSELDDEENQPLLTASGTNLDVPLILDGKIDAQSTLNTKGNIEPWIQFNYKKPKTLRSAKIIFNDRHATATLQISEDGKRFEDVRSLFKVRTGKGEWAINDHFDGITSKIFRLKFNQKVTLKEVQLTSNYFIENPLARTLIARTENHKLGSIGTPSPEMIIQKTDVINLSESMNDSGVLEAKLPKGKWTVLRFGYTSTGAFNNPASDQGRGLEVDKLNRPAFKNFFDGFVKKVIDNTKPLAPNALQYIEIDSYEMGGQNWTTNLDSIFTSIKGYDLISFLPLISGRFVDDTESSEAVLSDYSDVITQLMTENYFEYFTELCNEAGLKSYIEPYGFGPLNDLDIGGVTDLPMGEFWMNRPITQVASAVSSAHIYGKPVISAESFTSNPTINWKGNPSMAKSSGDLAWTQGINEFMFHRFAHQANVHAEPGMTMNRWGFHFDRTQTWWENAGADWFEYIARGSYMLRQGHPVSDLLVYIGEGTPNGSYHRSELGFDLPKTINFDNVNTDVLVNRLEIDNNEMHLPEGTSYKVLFLKNCAVLSLTTIERIYKIAKSGVPVYGELPEKIKGYNVSESERNEFQTVLEKLTPLINRVQDWNKILASHNLIPDLEVHQAAPVDYIHRKTQAEDIYFFFNQDTLLRNYDISFRVPNRIPELWNPMTGEIVKKADFRYEKNRIRTTIALDAGESVFVVFRESANTMDRVTSTQANLEYSYLDTGDLTATISENGSYDVPLSSGKTWALRIDDIPEMFPVDGPWGVRFNKENGYGGAITVDKLFDWKDHVKDSIKYYSGTATYETTFDIPAELINDNVNAILDLGTIHIVAEVMLNNERVGISWMPPYKLDLQDHLVVGENKLEIQLTNLWSNRLIGDERHPANDGGYKLGPHRATDLTMPEWYTNNEPRPEGKRTTFTTAPFYKIDSPLMPSGLIGPVEIRFSKTMKYNND